MVGAGADFVGGKFFGKEFRGLAAGAIDDAALAGTGLEEREDLAVGLLLGDDAVGEVVAIEAADDDGGVDKVEMADDVLSDATGGGGGEGHDGDAGKTIAERAELMVLRAEVVAPLRDAMGFVHDDAADVPGIGAVEEAREQETLGGGVEETLFTCVEGAEAGFGLGGVEGGIEEGGRDAGELEGINLVLHQGDEGRDDNGKAGFHDGWKLEAERLAAAGGEEGEDVAAGERLADDLFLAGAEGVEAEVLLKGG